MISNRKTEDFFLSKVEDGTLRVTKYGKIFNNKTGRWIGTGNRRGYKGISMMDPSDGKVKTMFVHRLVYLVHHGRIPEGMVVNHKDGRKWNNRPKNLECETDSGNNQHAINTGLRPGTKGEDRHNSKFTNDQVRKYRRSYKRGDITPREVADECNVHRVTAYYMLEGISYSSVK